MLYLYQSSEKRNSRNSYENLSDFLTWNQIGSKPNDKLFFFYVNIQDISVLLS